MNLLNRVTVCAGALLGLVVLPQTSFAHGQYLQGVNDTIGAELGTPACELPGTTCGLCHEPSEGDRLENIVVEFNGIETGVRNGPFYDSLTMNAGWSHAPHADDMNAHRDMNLALLLDTALPAMLADEIDSDMDEVPDLVELQLGYNPLLAYEPGDPGRSQLCDAAGAFPGDGGESGDGDGDGGESGDGDGDGGESGDGDGDSQTGDGDGDEQTGGGESSSDTGTAEAGEGGTTGETGGETGGETAGAESGGCSTTADEPSPLALLVLFSLGFALRPRER